MNSQIEKLALECGAWHQVYESKRFMHDHNFDIEKFAELIVAECIGIADEYDGVGSTIVSRIEKHFGVEELDVCKHDWYSAKNPVVQNGSVCVICGAIDAREPEELKNERTN